MVRWSSLLEGTLIRLWRNEVSVPELQGRWTSTHAQRNGMNNRSGRGLNSSKHNLTNHFRLEDELTPEILRFVPRLVSNASRLAVAVELPIQHRVVDVALASMTATVYQHLQGPHIRLLRRLALSDIFVLGHLADQKVITRELVSARFSWMAWRTWKAKYLDRFVALGLLVTDLRGAYRLGDWGKLLPNRIVTVEAKISRWRDALRQALFNLRVADYSYVALPEDRLLGVSLEPLQQSGIGLLAIAPKGKSRVIRLAQRNRPQCPGHALAERIRVLRDIAGSQGFWTMLSA